MIKANIPLTILAIFFLFLAGCSGGSSYYYNPDKTLQETRTDWETCNEDLLRITFSGHVVEKEFILEHFEDQAHQCMIDKGYRLIEKDKIEGLQYESGKKGYIEYGIAGR